MSPFDDSVAAEQHSSAQLAGVRHSLYETCLGRQVIVRTLLSRAALVRPHPIPGKHAYSKGGASRCAASVTTQSRTRYMAATNGFSLQRGAVTPARVRISELRSVRVTRVRPVSGERHPRARGVTPRTGVRPRATRPPISLRARDLRTCRSPSKANPRRRRARPKNLP